MKVLNYRKQEVTSMRFYEKNEEFDIIIETNTLLKNYTIKAEQMSIEDINAIKRFDDGTHKLVMYSLDDKFVKFNTTKRIVKMGVAIDKYVDRPFPPIELINYIGYNIFTQLDGITALVGMSGAGKTYSALRMLQLFAQEFTKIAYLNYELTNRDIVQRLDEMYPMGYSRDNILKKLYMKDGIMTSLDLDDILQAMDVMPSDKVVFIVDNVGSVIGQEDNVWQKQNEFLKELDTICKERGYHALALTQIVKNNNLKIFDENGEFEKDLTMSIMSGSIMLGNLSRSVLLTGFNGNNEFKQKVLKRGTGVFYNDLKNRKDVTENVITR